MIDKLLVAILDHRTKKRVLRERKYMKYQPCEFEFKHSVTYRLTDGK